VVLETTASLVNTSHGVLRARAELTYDAAATLARVQHRDALARAELEGRRELEVYSLEHDAEAELGSIRSTLVEAIDDPGGPTLLEGFHARASRAQMWQLLVDLPSGPARDHLIQWLAIDPAMRGQRLTDEAVPIVRARLFVDEELAELVMILADERFRPEISRFARHGDPTTRARARVALAQMDERRRPSLEDVIDAEGPEQMVWLARGYIEGATDPRDVVPLLLDVVLRPDEDRWLAMEAIVLMQQITCRAIADDPLAWRTFYEAYRDRPYADWLYDASHELDRIARLAAAVALDEREDPRGRERLRELARDTDPITRFVAAEALAQRGDAVGLPQIIAMMRDPSRHAVSEQRA
jgi:hypothetical protein